jgi:hypothetical protein
MVLLAPEFSVTVPGPWVSLIQLRRQGPGWSSQSLKSATLLCISLLPGGLRLLCFVGEQPFQQIGQLDGLVRQIDFWIRGHVRELYVFAPALIRLGADQLPLAREDAEKDSTPESVSFHVHFAASFHPGP